VGVARPQLVVWLFSYKSVAASLLSGRSLSSCDVEGGGKFQ